MAIDFNTLADFDLSQFTGVIPDVSGAVMLEPHNYVPGQFMDTLDQDGAPVGWSKVAGPAAGGYHAYLFLTSGNVRQGGRQTFSPDGAEQASHLFNKPLTSGGLAPTASTPGVAVPASPLEAPTVTKAATGVSGFQQGEYLAAISLVDKGGNHTMTTNTTQLTINTDGKLVEFKLLLDADRTTVAGQGLWLSEPVAVGGTPDEQTLRLQAVAPNSGRTYTIPGPYNYSGRLAPTKNETELGAPPALIIPRDFQGVGGTSKWTEPGRYVFYQVQVTALGDSAVSAPSQIVERKTWVQSGIWFHPQLSPSAIGYKIFWQDFYESSSPPFYQLVRTHTGDPTRYFGPTDAPMFFGNKESGDIATQNPGPKTGEPRAMTASTITSRITLSAGSFPNGQEIRFTGSNLPSPIKEGRSYWVRDVSGTTFKVAGTKGGAAITLTTTGGGVMRVFTYTYVKPPETYFTASISADPPIEDASGIPNPTGDIDPPTAVGLGIPEAGTYLVGYTRVLDGQETPISDMVSITLTSGDVTAGMVIKMDYPPRVNKIPNALYGQVNQQALPLNWDIRNSTNVLATAPVTGQIELTDAGVLSLTTSGSLANTGRYPNAQTKAGFEIALDPARIETLAGWLAVANRTSGNAYIEVVQLNASKVEVGTRLNLATLAANGAVEFQKTIGSADVSPDLVLDPTAVYGIVQWGAEGNPRSLRVSAYSLIWSPQRGVGRRYIAPAVPSDPWTPTTDPSAPWPSSHLLAIGQPPPTAASIAANAVAPTVSGQVELLNYDALADGAEPTGWTEVVTTGTTAGAFTNTAWGNAKTYRVTSTNTSALSTAYMKKTFSSWSGTTVAIIVRMKVTAWNQSGEVTAFSLWAPGATITTADPPLGFTFRNDGGSQPMRMVWRFPTGSSSAQNFAIGQNIEIKIELSGFGTTSGTITYYTRLQGSSTWVVATSRSAQNFASSGFTTGFQVVQGISYEASSGATWTIDYGQLYVGTTEQAQITNTAPALTPLVQPDWPWLAGTVLNGPNTSPVDYTYTTANNAGLGVAATFNRTTTLAAERTLEQIRSSAGTEVVGLYMKTDHTVELRKGATLYPVSAAVPTGTDYRFDVIVGGAGGSTTGGIALVYRTIGTGKRELIVLAQSLDFSAVQAQRATVANNTELTETAITVTASGEYTYANTGPRGSTANQGYVSILPADVTNTDIGFVVDEFVVKPAAQRTAAVFMKPEDLPVGAAPFTIVAYDPDGRSIELGSIYANGTADANPSTGWAEYWLVYTPPDGYPRIRIEHRGMTAGRYVFQNVLDAPGNLNTTALRAAARDDRRAIEGTYTVILNARIPGRASTMVGTDYREMRTGLDADATLPIPETFTFTADATTDVLTLSAAHRFVVDSRVQLLTTTTLPAPLLPDTTYYVRDVTTNTLKLSATEGGAAINITNTGTGTHTLSGRVLVSSRWRSSDDLVALTGLPWQTDKTLVPDLEWVQAEMTLEGDGTYTPIVSPGSPRVTYVPWMPMLLHADRTPLYGGVYVGGGGQANNLFPPFWRSLYDSEPVAGRAAPRAITDPLGALFGFTLNVMRPEALAEIYSDRFLAEDYVIVSPFHDLLLRVRFYDPPDRPAAMFEYEGFDESRPFAVSQFMPMVVAIDQAEVIESAVLSGEAPGATDEAL